MMKAPKSSGLQVLWNTALEQVQAKGFATRNGIHGSHVLRCRWVSIYAMLLELEFNK
jgi:hypothetical protein